MPHIAAHHKPGHPLQSDGGYVLTQDWPDDCYVQWGSSGVVVSKTGGYQTAFFEAFPEDNAGGFLRGEGKTIEEAELAAFKRWQREKACDHEWGRAGYANGGGKCRKCKAFDTKFAPIVELGAWKAPLSSTELIMIRDGLLRPTLWYSREDEAQSRRTRRRIKLRAKMFALKLPPDPEPQVEPTFEEDDYTIACAAAVLEYYVRERKRLIEDGGKMEPGIAMIWQAFEICGLEREAREMGLLEGVPPLPAKEKPINGDAS